MRLNKTWRDAKKKMCKERDGDKCYLHPKYFQQELAGDEYRKQTGKDFDLDHKDNNKRNNADENLGLACHQCNCIKWGEYRKAMTMTEHLSLKIQSFRNVSTRVQIDENNLPVIRYAEFAKGYIAEPIIYAELEKIFKENDKVERKDLIDALVNKSKLSPERIKPRLEGWLNPLNGHLVEDKIEDEEGKKYIRKRTQ